MKDSNCSIKAFNHPKSEVIPGEFKRFGKVVDIYAPGIGGLVIALMVHLLDF